jgi:MFS family permease
MERSPMSKIALRFVIIMGVVNLFADMTYEGARGVAGAFLGHLGANGAAVGIIAGGGELAGYLIRSVSGAIADRTGRYWINAWVGYAINMLCVPALALAGSWPAAAGLLIGERVGRGIRKPVIAAALSEAGRHVGSGRAFGINEALDQIGATAGPLIVAFAVARGGYAAGFGILIVPALATLAIFGAAASAGRTVVPRADEGEASIVRDWPALRRYAIGGALFAAGYVDFALIAFHFQHNDVMSVPAISVSFALAMAVGALAAPMLGRFFDRVGKPLAESGAALWGVGIAVQDALLLALVSTAIARKKATAFGLYDLAFGIAWFAGSVVSGVLLDRSISSLVLFSTLLQLCAIPFFTGGNKGNHARMATKGR